MNAADALNYSNAVSDWIDVHHPTEVQGSPSTMLAGPSFAMCLEHREAILLLMRHGARSSAFALTRSVYEAYIRGLWAQHCATPNAIQNIRRTHALPKFDTVIRALDKTGGKQSSFAATKKFGWDAMSDYAHAGISQLARWSTEDSIGPSFSDAEVATILFFIDLYGVLACMGMAELAGLPVTAHVAMAQAVNREGRLRKSLIKPP